LGKSGGFNEKRVSEIDPFSPDIKIRTALLLIVLFVSLAITLYKLCLQNIIVLISYDLSI